MRIAFLSDIHANLPALKATLTHLARQAYDKIVVLGDIVGYGAEPGPCVDLVMELTAQGATTLKGNHDAALELGAAVDMHDEAYAAIQWTGRQLDPGQRAFLKALPLQARDETRLYVHASAHRPDAWGYITTAREAERSLGATDARLVLCGHTHLPTIFSLQPNGVALPFTPRTGVAVPLMPNRRWQVVVGSIGQPRDGDPGASYSILDVAQGAVTAHRVPYDHAEAAARIRAAGLPERLAARLARGR